MNAAILKRLRAMDGAELRFRAAAAVRSRVERARTTLQTPTWRRELLRLTSDPALSPARAALERHDWAGAHAALATHFSSRTARFPLDPRHLQQVSAQISSRCPDGDAAERAERVLSGSYDLLGYRGVRTPSPPDWHLDPVHQKRAPMNFWESVPYLDPTCGDHKITWELNRHQHFLTLGRAYALTGDRRYYREFVTQITSWIAANPPLLGTNWASMLELAFRCLSWLWALHFFAGAAVDDDGTQEPWIVDLLVALDRQMTHVEQNLSRYFSPNTHLSGEALALYVSGRALPELEASASRADTGRAVLIEEATRQIREDGMHAELSAHYHRYSTDFYLLALTVARITGDDAEAALGRTALQQARALRLLADDRGRLPLLGDDDGGQLFPICGRPVWDCTDTLATAAVLLKEPSLALDDPPEETWWLCASSMEIPQFEAAPSPAPSAGLAASGYYVSRNALGDHLVFDCGPHGFLNGGHAHADALSVVLTIRGLPFLVDPGTATYTMDPQRRDRFRSSVMHNTVIVGDRNQSEASGPFHWRSRTDAICSSWQTTPERDYISGEHDAYAPVRHHREVLALHGTGWIILDRLTGGARVDAAAMWHVHPGWVLEHLADNSARFTHVDGLVVTLTTSVPLERVDEPSLNDYSPEYGQIVSGTCLRSRAGGSAPLSLAAFIVASTVHPH
ncbi:MAG: heparinase II/III family protein [Acidobacteriota bacterium]|nr:heparinase II/III family protein [Acidobacteriota bacterium]